MIGAWGLVASVLVQAVSMVLLMVAVLVIAFLVMRANLPGSTPPTDRGRGRLKHA